LIEYATGVYSGSVYNDKSLLPALPGEFSCDWRVSVVKVRGCCTNTAMLYSHRPRPHQRPPPCFLSLFLRPFCFCQVHPHTHPFTPDLKTGPFHSDGPDKCRAGGVPYFDRAVLLIRDPFDRLEIDRGRMPTVCSLSSWWCLWCLWCLWCCVWGAVFGPSFNGE
jgi:hypothetical protein